MWLCRPTSPPRPTAHGFTLHPLPFTIIRRSPPTPESIPSVGSGAPCVDAPASADHHVLAVIFRRGGGGRGGGDAADRGHAGVGFGFSAYPSPVRGASHRRGNRAPVRRTNIKGNGRRPWLASSLFVHGAKTTTSRAHMHEQRTFPACRFPMDCPQSLANGILRQRVPASPRHYSTPRQVGPEQARQ